MSEVLSRYDHDGLRYYRAGDGPSLLLLHGLPGSSHTWKGVGRLLTSQYDVVIPDLPAFGESQPLAESLHLDHDFYLEAYAETVHRLLEHLEIDSLYLGGHDFGGPVAITLCRLFREYEIKGLALSATNVFTDPHVPLPLRFATIPVLGTTFFRLFAGTRTGLRLLYRLAANNKTTFTIHDFERHLTSSGVKQTWRIFHRSLANLKESYRDVEAALPDLTVPAIVLWGDSDPFFSVETAHRTADALPDARTSIFENTGHFVPEERPVVTAWHMSDFFQSRSTAPSKRRFPGWWKYES